MESPDTFQRNIRAKYKAAFILYRDVASTLEPAVFRRRNLPDEIAIVLDMLMIQAYKAHGSVYFLAVRALVEDAATITRRLLEIAVQAGFIAGRSDLNVQKERSRCYLLHLWDSCLSEWRTEFSESEQKKWAQFSSKYGHLLPRGAKKWGPDFKTMFKELGALATYEQDYSLLSSIAHGNPPSLVKDYAKHSVEVRSDRFVPVTLVFASRYYLAMADLWNQVFHLVEAGQIGALKQRAVEFFAGTKSGLKKVHT